MNIYKPFVKTTYFKRTNLCTIMWVVFFVCTNCSQTDAPLSLQLSEVTVSKVRQYTINSRDSVSIGRLRPLFKSNNDGSLYAFLDEIHQRIILTDSLGNVNNEIGKKGKGPEEFVQISGFLLDQDNHLIVYDGRQLLIKFFDEYGNFYNSFILNQKDIDVTHDALVSYKNKLLFGALEKKYLSNLLKAGESKNFIEYSYEGTFLSSFGKYDSLTNSMMDYLLLPVLSLDNETGYIYSVRANGYIIEGWDVETKKRNLVINQKPNFFTHPKKKIAQNLEHKEIMKRSIDMTFTSGLFVTEKFVYLYMEKITEDFMYSTDKDPSKKIQLLAIYSKAGKLLAETKLDHVLANIIDDNLHLIENDDPDNYTIGVYEFSLD